MELVKGYTIEEKIASITKILEHFQQRLSTKVIGFIPPVIMTHWREVPGKDGLVYKALIPIDGEITTVHTHVDLKGLESAEFKVRVYSQSSEYSTSHRISEKDAQFVVNYPCKAGDIITIYTTAEVEDIYVGFLLHADKRYYSRREYILESVLRLIDQEARDAKEEL